MKNLLFWSAMAALIVLSGCSAQKQRKSEREKEREYAVIAAIENMDYTVAITRGHPMSGSTLTADYSITVKDDKVDVHLPFIGQAYYITFEERGIDFTTEILDYVWTVSKNQSILISFKARTGEEYYRFALEVFTNGTSYVTLTPLNKQAMTYTGEIVVPDYVVSMVH